MPTSISAVIEEWLASFPPFPQDATLAVDEPRLRAVAADFGERMRDNYPFHHPLYAGQMLKPPHPLAAAAYSAAMQINPNNHALDGGPATATMEKEVIREYAALFGFSKSLGHLTTSGTLANFEALLIARELHPEMAVAFSDQAHYTHSRVCGWLKIKPVVIASDHCGRMDLTDLEARLRDSNIGTVIVTLATTSLGALDDLAGVLRLQRLYPFRIHVDAAYGGYFRLLAERFAKLKGFALINQCDSLTFDPHKQGLQPYGCGCVIFRDSTVGRFYKHDSPYTYFTSNELHLGEISVECSRAGAAAAALWFTHQLFPLKAEEGFGPILGKTISAAERFAERLKDSQKFTLYAEPETNIVTYFPKGETTQAISEASETLMQRLMHNNRLWIATLKVSINHFAANHPQIPVNSDSVLILRSCLLKPEQLDWIDEIMTRLQDE